jgi:hypothetical protein
LEKLLQILCSRWKFGKIRYIYSNKHLKIWDDEIKLKVTQNLAYKKYLQTQTTDNENEYAEEPLPKEK